MQCVTGHILSCTSMFFRCDGTAAKIICRKTVEKTNCTCMKIVFAVKVFRRLHFSLTKEDIEAVASGEPQRIERILKLLKYKVPISIYRTGLYSSDLLNVTDSHLAHCLCTLVRSSVNMASPRPDPLPGPTTLFTMETGDNACSSYW